MNLLNNGQLLLIVNKMFKHINIKLLENPKEILWVDTTNSNITTIKPNNNNNNNDLICFGPNANEALNPQRWYNTNDYTPNEWTKDFLHVSYYGGCDLNSLIVYEEEHCGDDIKWKRITGKNNQMIYDNDYIIFIGVYDDWKMFIKTYLTSSIPDKLYKYVYVCCILQNEPLPWFNYYQPSSKHWMVKYIQFETPEFRKFYPQVKKDNDDDIIMYYISSKYQMLPNQVYVIKNPDEAVEYTCGVKCPIDCKLGKKNLNSGVHHYIFHCKTPQKCCYPDCNARNNTSCLRYHYKTFHKDDDIYLKAWKSYSKLKILTKHTVVSVNFTYISDMIVIYPHFYQQIENLKKSRNAFTIAYLLGQHTTPISIEGLSQELYNTISMEDIYDSCMDLVKIKFLDIEVNDAKIFVSFKELSNRVNPNSSLYTDTLKYLVGHELIKNFQKCLFSIDILYEWMDKAFLKNGIIIPGLRKQKLTFNDCEKFRNILSDAEWLYTIDGNNEKQYINLYELLQSSTNEKFINILILSLKRKYLLASSVLQIQTDITKQYFKAQLHNKQNFDIVYQLATLVQFDKKFIAIDNCPLGEYKVKSPRNFKSLYDVTNVVNDLNITNELGFFTYKNKIYMDYNLVDNDFGKMIIARKGDCREYFKKINNTYYLIDGTVLSGINRACEAVDCDEILEINADYVGKEYLCLFDDLIKYNLKKTTVYTPLNYADMCEYWGNGRNPFNMRCEQTKTEREVHEVYTKYYVHKSNDFENILETLSEKELYDLKAVYYNMPIDNISPKLHYMGLITLDLKPNTVHYDYNARVLENFNPIAKLIDKYIDHMYDCNVLNFIDDDDDLMSIL